MSYLSIPKMGESVAEATILNWMFKEGDTIPRDQAYIEISTDKVDSEIPAPYKCKLVKIICPVGATISVGQPIAEVEWLEVVSESSVVSEVKSLINTSNNQKSSVQLRESNEANSELKLSPLVRQLLISNQIPISEIQDLEGSGNDGRLTKEDILSYISNREHFQSQIAEKNYYNSSNQESKSTQAQNYQLETGDSKIEFDRMRSLIARYMIESKQKSAHCTSFSEVDVTNLVQWRDQVKDEYTTKTGDKLTYTHLFMHLIIDSLKRFPKINAHSIDGGYVLKSNINLGFATALPDGNLIVPNIKSIQSMNIIDIVKAVSSIGNNAKANQLKPEDIQNGTFTMSNTGIFGSLMGTPIINQPQVAIMSLGEILKTPAVVEVNGKDEILVRKKMILSLSYDHRIIDGAYAASFLKDYKSSIESFQSVIF